MAAGSHAAPPPGGQGGNMAVPPVGAAPKQPVWFDASIGMLKTADGKVLVAKRGDKAIEQVGELQKIASLFKPNSMAGTLQLAKGEKFVVGKKSLQILDASGRARDIPQFELKKRAADATKTILEEKQEKLETRIANREAARAALNSLETNKGYNTATMQAAICALYDEPLNPVADPSQPSRHCDILHLKGNEGLFDAFTQRANSLTLGTIPVNVDNCVKDLKALIEAQSKNPIKKPTVPPVPPAPPEGPPDFTKQADLEAAKEATAQFVKNKLKISSSLPLFGPQLGLQQNVNTFDLGKTERGEKTEDKAKTRAALIEKEIRDELTPKITTPQQPPLSAEQLNKLKLQRYALQNLLFAHKARNPAPAAPPPPPSPPPNNLPAQPDVTLEEVPPAGGEQPPPEIPVILTPVDMGGAAAAANNVAIGSLGVKQHDK